MKSFLKNLPLVFFDVETTGLNPYEKDAICEIGAVKMEEDVIVDTFQTLINPKREIPPYVSSIHHIYDEDVKDAPYFEDIADKFLDFLKDSIICGYNLSFDLSFLNKELERINYPLLENSPTIDVLKMARRSLKLTRYSLAYVCTYLGVKAERFHRAQEDAYLTSQIFLKIKKELEKKGIAKIEELVSLFALPNQFLKNFHQPLLAFLKECIEEKFKIKVRYFSYKGLVEFIFLPKLISDNFILGKREKEEIRLKITRILDVEII